MNQAKFCITMDGETINTDIEGGAQDLINLLANVINED